MWSVGPGPEHGYRQFMVTGEEAGGITTDGDRLRH